MLRNRTLFAKGWRSGLGNLERSRAGTPSGRRIGRKRAAVDFDPGQTRRDTTRSERPASAIHFRWGGAAVQRAREAARLLELTNQLGRPSRLKRIRSARERGQLFGMSAEGKPASGPQNSNCKTSAHSARQATKSGEILDSGQLPPSKDDWSGL